MVTFCLTFSVSTNVSSFIVESNIGLITFYFLKQLAAGCRGDSFKNL